MDTSVKGLNKFASINSRDKSKCARLVVRQLKVGKVDLKSRAASLTPPPPPHLLTQDALLLNLECTVEGQFCLTVREGETIFDQ